MNAEALGTSNNLFSGCSRFNKIKHMIRIMYIPSVNDTAETEIKVLAALAFISRTLNVLQRGDVVSH